MPLPGSVCGVTIKLKPVAKAPKYLQATFMDATLEACDNCKAMMRHANIVYRDWYHQGMFRTYRFYQVVDVKIRRRLHRNIIGHCGRPTSFHLALLCRFVILAA